MDPVDALRAMGGSSRPRSLASIASRHSLRAAVADGRLVRVGSAYCLPTCAREMGIATSLGAVLSHQAAAAQHGLALPPPRDTIVQVTVPWRAQRRNVPADVRLAYRDLPATSVIGAVTTATQTVLDCLRDEELRVALSVGDSALRAGVVEHDELGRRVQALRGPGSRRARDRLALLDARSANAFESSTRALLIDAGILGFTPQVWVSHGRQIIGRADLADVVRLILVECDGFATHGARRAMVRDATRHTWYVAAGWRPLRVTWEQVMFQPEWVVARVTDTVRLMDGPPSPAAQIAAKRSARAGSSAA